MSKEKRAHVATLASNGNISKIYHLPVWAEYVVEFHPSGQPHNKKADYHTADKQDAHDTAKHALVLMSKAARETAK